VAAPVLAAGSASAAAPCASAWKSGSAYTGGMSVSYHGDDWTAKRRTQGDTPGSSMGVWADQGPCGGSIGGGGGSSGGGGTSPRDTSGFVVSEDQFNQMFPNRNSFYTYSGLVDALSAYPGFAATGSDTVQKQEAAAFLANVDHETGGLVYITEIDQSGNYCDASQPYGCPAGQSAYYGRGPLQLSWNFNYKAAGDALGIDLLDNPNLVATDEATSWKTGLWYWNTQTGPGSMTAHNAMVSGAGFGETIRAINGSIECNGGNTAEMQDRVNDYEQFVQILGVPAGSNLTC
jgi:predicted chitinase